MSKNIKELDLEKRILKTLEILACYIEYSWFVKQEDLVKAYKIIYDLCRPNE